MSKQVFIRHRFGGGWATDIGPTTDIVPDSGQLLIPYLLNVDNAFFELDGAPHKEYGTVELFESSLAPAPGSITFGDSANTVTGVVSGTAIELTIDASSSRKAVLIASTEKSTSAPNTATFNGNAMTALTLAQSGATAMLMFWYDIPDGLAPGTYDVVCNTTNSAFWIGAAFWASGVALGAPQNETAEGEENTVDGGVLIEALPEGSIVFSAAGDNGNDTDRWESATDTEVVEIATAEDGGHNSVFGFATGLEGNYTTGWTRSNLAGRVVRVGAGWGPVGGAAATSVPIKGLFDYWRQGTVGNPIQHRVLHIADKVYADDANGIFREIFDGLVSGAVPHYSQFDDILIIGSDAVSDTPKSWDGLTAQDLAGSPPNFAFSVVHSGHVFAAGVASDPSGLYFSVPFDPEDWTGAGSGRIAIDPDDGDMITGIVSYKQRLIVFKGPNKGSIHIITGTSEADFAHVVLQSGIGAVWQNLITRFRDDIAFLWSDGHLYSLGATEQFGDFREGAQITRDVSSWLTEHLNFTRLKHVQIVTWSTRGIMLLALPIDSAQHSNFILMVDYRFDPPRLAPWSSFDHMTALALVSDTISKRRIVMAGGSDGKVYRLGQPTRSLLDGTTAIEYDVRTPFFSYGNSFMLKTLQTLAIGFAPHNIGDLDFIWRRDDNAAQSLEVSQGGGNVLGPADENEFTLGTSTLGGAQFVDKFVDIENGGQFRTIQFEMRDSVNNQDVEIHSLSSVVELDGPSWQN